MTLDACYAAVKSLGLSPSTVPNVFIDRSGMTRSVPDPLPMTQEQREETLAKVKYLMGIRD